MVVAGNALLARDDLSRRERRKREVRDRMLAASTTLFEEKGFGPTTVAEICARADVAHKTFFNHFPSKQHLLRAVARVQLEELVAVVETARREGRSTRERLTRFFQLLAARIDAAGPMRRELVTEMIHVAYEGGGQQTQARTLRRAFGALVRDGLAQGDVTRDHGVDTLTEVVVGAFYALMFNWANFARYPFRARALAAARFLGDALSTGRRKR